MAKLVALALGVLAVAHPLGPGWKTFSAGGVSVRYPTGWFATAQPLTAVTSPKQALAVASYRFRPDIVHANGCEPQEALDAMPANGAFIYGWESLPGSPQSGPNGFKPRPRHFTLTGFGHYDCLGTRPGYMLWFGDHGHAFTVEIAFGPRASAATRATVLEILDSFTSKPR